MKFCKDCRHVDKETLSVRSVQAEEAIECNRITESDSFYISEVTGQKLVVPATKHYCKYERALGNCKNAQFFEMNQCLRRKLSGLV